MGRGGGSYSRPGIGVGWGLGERAAGRAPNSSSVSVFKYCVIIRRGFDSVRTCSRSGTTKRGSAARLGFSCVGVGVNR